MTCSVCAGTGNYYGVVFDYPPSACLRCWGEGEVETWRTEER